MPAEAFRHRVDRYSPTWLAVDDRLRADIERIRDQLEYDHPPEHTANLRGQLTYARSMLQLGAEDGGIQIPQDS